MSETDDVPPGQVVRELVALIPTGRVATYGVIGRAAAAMGRPIGGARTVAWILAGLKGRDATPWQRVVGAGGRILLPDRRGALQRRRLRSEGVIFRKGLIAAGCLIGEAELLSTPKRRG